MDTGVNSDGANPFAGLILSGTTLYGAAQAGGTHAIGTIFSLNTYGGTLDVLSDFSAGKTNREGTWTNADGAYPDGTLLLSGNFLFGTAYEGGTHGNGCVFTLSTGTDKFTNLYSFNTGDDGAHPSAGLVLDGAKVIGTASGGGNWNTGTIFSVNTNATGFANFYIFDSTDGIEPMGGLVLSGGTLYGTSIGGGISSNGVVFEVNTNGTGYPVLTNFAALDPDTGTNIGGANPQGNLALAGGVLYGTATGGGTGADGTVFSVGTNGSGFKVLWNFTASETNSDGFYTNADGVGPEAGLVLSGGALFGTTYEGGESGLGTVFVINTNSTGFKVLWNFTAGDTDADGLYTNSDGADPEAGLVVSGTNLFGATYYGGSNGTGTLFCLGTNGGGFTVLKVFSATDQSTGSNPDGANPYGSLILSGAMLFGTSRRRRQGGGRDGLHPRHQRRRVQRAVGFLGDGRGHRNQRGRGEPGCQPGVDRQQRIWNNQRRRLLGRRHDFSDQHQHERL